MDQLEHIKTWCLQDRSDLTKKQILQAVINMCNDGLSERNAELTLEQIGRTCPACDSDSFFRYWDGVRECFQCESVWQVR